MRVLVVDIGGTNLKILVSGRTEPRKTPSGPGLTPRKMVAAVKDLVPGNNVYAFIGGYRLFEKPSDHRRPVAATSTPRRKAAGEALRVAAR